MIRIGIAIVLLAASSAAARSPEWRVDPPAGWRKDAATVRELRAKVKAADAPFEEFDVAYWRNDDASATLTVQWCRLSLAREIQRQIDAFDRGVLRGFGRASGSGPAEIAAPSQRIVGSMVIRENSVDELNGQEVHVRVVRRYQAAEDGLHALVMSCAAVSDIAACNAAIDGARFAVADPVALDDRTHDLAYRIGYQFGKVLVFAALGVVIWAFIRGSRRSRRRVTAAAPPGSPPGPGAGADGR